MFKLGTTEHLSDYQLFKEQPASLSVCLSLANLTMRLKSWLVLWKKLWKRKPIIQLLSVSCQFNCSLKWVVKEESTHQIITRDWLGRENFLTPWCLDKQLTNSQGASHQSTGNLVLETHLEIQKRGPSYEGVPKSFGTGRLEPELQMVLLSATRCSCIILWVSLVSFAAITLRRGQQRVIPKVNVYFVNDSVRKLLDTLSYGSWYMLVASEASYQMNTTVSSHSKVQETITAILK
jgi:hypothetical protein